MPDVNLIDDAQIAERGRYYHHERVIALRAGLLIAEKRAVLWHELVHAERGDKSCTGKQEASVDREAARRAMPWPVLKWGVDRCTNLAELVDLMKVDERLVRIRLETAHPAEKAHIARRRAVYEESA